MSDFATRFNLPKESEADTKRKFLNRIDVSIFNWLSNASVFFNPTFILWLSQETGEPWHRHINDDFYGGSSWVDTTLSKMASGDFYRALELVEYCYKYFNSGKYYEAYHHHIVDRSEIVNAVTFNERMEQIMLLSNGVGVFWKDGKFYPSGAKELDEALIAENLTWLNSYPEAKEHFATALKHYGESQQDSAARKDALTNAMTSLETLGQSILNNEEHIDSNSDRLVDAMQLPKEYKELLKTYRKLGHGYSSRHAGDVPTPQETEAFIYMTGLLLRALSR